MISRRSLFGMLGIGAPAAAIAIGPRQAAATMAAENEALRASLRMALDAQAMAAYPVWELNGTTGVTKIIDPGHTHPIFDFAHSHWTIKT